MPLQFEPAAMTEPKPAPPIAGVIADLDGVLYRGDAPIADAVRAFQHWEQAGTPYAFVTNNATKSANAFADKLTRMGVKTAPDQVITSSIATAAYLQTRWAPKTPVYVLGSAALAAVVEQAGFLVTEDKPAAVVVGLDRDFTYARLRTAVRAILAGATFIGTNADILLPVEDGFDPGAGTMLAAIAAATRTQPLIIGKPEPRMIEMALERLGTPRENTVMIGDQIATDILAGQRAGLRSILVTTGVAGDASGTPDQTVDSLMELVVPSRG